MNFEFATATRILFGPGTLREVGPIAAALGRRALIVTGRDVGRAEPLRRLLHQEGITDSIWAVAGEPTVEGVGEGVDLIRAERTELIIGLGGGSAIDAAKAVAALATNEGLIDDYLEVIGRGQPLSRPPLPVIAIPTTAGTGAEVTRNAVLASVKERVKISLRSPLMLPKLAVVDPELARHLPPGLTASTGLDALTQLIEAYVSCRANPMTDGFCRDGIARAGRSLRTACGPAANPAAREDMAMASLLSGLALANAGLGAVHGFAGPIGGMFAAPHGAVCAALLPETMEVNLRALRDRPAAGRSDAINRFEQVAAWLTGRPEARAEDGIAWIRSLRADLGIPSLGRHGITPGDGPLLCDRAARSSSMKGNPLLLLPTELEEILTQAL